MTLWLRSQHFTFKLIIDSGCNPESLPGSKCRWLKWDLLLSSRALDCTVGKWVAAKIWIPIFQYSPSMTMSVWSITKSLREGCTEFALSRELLKKKNYSSLCTVLTENISATIGPNIFSNHLSSFVKKVGPDLASATIYGISEPPKTELQLSVYVYVGIGVCMCVTET